MNLDQLTALLGQFGPYQRQKYFLMCLFSTVSALHALNMIFVGAEPKFHCKIPEVNLSFSNISQKTITDLLLPENNQCQQYNMSEIISMVVNFDYNFTAVKMFRYNTSLLTCKEGYDYSQESYISTITSDFNLVCENSYWRSTSKSVFFMGRLFGAIIFGQLSDRFGRRPVFLFGIFTLLIAGIAAALSPSIYIFLPSYFLQGSSHTGVFLISFTLCTELVGPKFRVLAGFGIQIFYGLGYLGLSILAYFIRNWRYLELAITLPVAFFGLYWWFLPESIPWLLSRGRDDEVEVILQKAAKKNGKSLTPQFSLFLREEAKLKASDRNYYFTDCIKNRKMAMLSLNVWTNWLINSLVFYGISLNSENMSGDPHINFCLIGAVGILSYIFCILIVNKLGRRLPLVIMMCIAGLSCVSAGFLVNKETFALRILLKVLILVGKFCITASYAIIYLMSAEIFPTVVRNAGMGVASMSARVGGIFAPIILDLKYTWGTLPLLTFGMLSFVTGLLSITLPETSERSLPQTFEDVSHGNERLMSKKLSGTKL